MQIFYAPGIIGPEYVMPSDESAHAVKVLRLGARARVHLVDGRGTLYEAEVTDPSPRGCRVRVVATTPDFGARGYRLTMAVAPTKNSERFEWFLEKATEVGLDAVIPLECAASERRCEPHRQLRKSERYNKLLVSAMKQSLKASLPALEPMTPFREIVARGFDGVKLIAHCRDDSPTPRVPIIEALRAATDASSDNAHAADEMRAATDILILIGPEGDFSAREVALAEAAGFIPVSLGQSRLRTETAALVAVTAVYLKNL